eukprot:gene11021-3727_t
MTFSPTKFVIFFSFFIVITLLTQIKSYGETNPKSKLVSKTSKQFKPSNYIQNALVNNVFVKLGDNETEHGDSEYCHVNDQNVTDPCEYVQENDECNKYLELNYCYLKETYLKPVYYIFMFFLIYLLFYLLGDTTELYFVPSLEAMSKYLKLSPNVAGVTLLALGNGAPDLSSIIIAVNAGSDSFGLGAAVGVGLFIVTVVLGVVCLSSEIKVTRRPFLRDTIFFFIATCFMFYTFLDNAVALWEGIVFILIYVIYVLVVVFGRIIRQQWNKRFGTTALDMISTEESEKDLDDDWTGGWRVFPKFEKEYDVPDEKQADEKTTLISDDIEQSNEKKDGMLSVYENHFSDPYFDSNEIDAEELKEFEESKVNQSLFRRFLNSFDWDEMPWYKKIHFVCIDGIWIFFRNLTIFRPEKENWNKYFATAVPLFSPFLIIYAIMSVFDIEFSEYEKYLIPLAILLVLGLIGSIFIFVTTEKGRPPIYQPVLVLFEFSASVLWIFIVADEILDALAALGIIWGISETILAITVLAWGNSIGDAVSDVIVARKGYPSMAIGSIFGSPMLNMLIGLGIAFTFNSTTLTEFCYPIDPDPVVSLTFIFLLLALISSIVIFPLSKFSVGKVYGEI